MEGLIVVKICVVSSTSCCLARTFVVPGVLRGLLHAGFNFVQRSTKLSGRAWGASRTVRSTCDGHKPLIGFAACYMGLVCHRVFELACDSMRLHSFAGPLIRLGWVCRVGERRLRRLSAVAWPRSPFPCPPRPGLARHEIRVRNSAGHRCALEIIPFIRSLGIRASWLLHCMTAYSAESCLCCLVICSGSLVAS